MIVRSTLSVYIFTDTSALTLTRRLDDELLRTLLVVYEFLVVVILVDRSVCLSVKAVYLTILNSAPSSIFMQEDYSL